MSDHDALLAAIEANPNDATPRNVYADWLDEHGEPVRAAAQRMVVGHVSAGIPAGLHVFEAVPTEHDLGIIAGLRMSGVVLTLSERLYALIVEARAESGCNLINAGIRYSGGRIDNHLTHRIYLKAGQTTGTWCEEMAGGCVRAAGEHAAVTVRGVAVLRDICLGLGRPEAAAAAWKNADAVAVRVAKLAADRAAKAEADRAAADHLARVHAAAIADAPAGRAGDLLRSNVGFVRAVCRDLRGKPGPGEIYFRLPTKGRFAKPFAMKKGRPLTAPELEAMAKEECHA